MTADKLITLHTGQEVPESALVTVMNNLERGQAEGQIIALYELRQACRNTNHILFGGHGEYLRTAGLVTDVRPDGTAEVHEHVKAVVLAALQGEGLAVRVGNPRLFAPAADGAGELKMSDEGAPKAGPPRAASERDLSTPPRRFGTGRRRQVPPPATFRSQSLARHNKTGLGLSE